MKVGQLIKKYRHKKGYTLEELSKLTFLSLSYLSKLERSDRIPPFATLQTLATALDFDITKALNLKKAEPKTEGDNDIIIYRSEHHERTSEQEDGYILMPLTTGYKSKAISPFLMEVLPGQTKDFTHDAEEFIYVLDGDVEVMYKDTTYEMHQGDSAYLDSRHVHKFINESDKNAYLISVNYMYRKF
ncbi:MAG: helix-turn-helix transcriptional regulator [Clostridia bacterium]|jgi:transcriptional regulator with XRE-family HTH domain|nr:helix-turn-helix transcriptional regulator [Clostridia bacterium]